MPNPQIKQIDVGDLTESVTSAVQRVIASQGDPPLWIRPPRIICGLIIDPIYEKADETAD
jgi:hypothetical protein